MFLVPSVSHGEPKNDGRLQVATEREQERGREGETERGREGGRERGREMDETPPIQASIVLDP